MKIIKQLLLIILTLTTTTLLGGIDKSESIDFKFYISDRHSLPLPVWFDGKDRKYKSKIQDSIRIDNLIIDGEQIEPVRAYAQIESAHTQTKGNVSQWEVFNLHYGELSDLNLLPIELPWERSIFWKWVIPEDWDHILISYTFCDIEGQPISHYVAAYHRKPKSSQSGDDNSE